MDYLIKVITEEQVLIARESNGLRKHRGPKKILEPSDYTKALSVLKITKGDDSESGSGSSNYHHLHHEGEMNGNNDMN